MWQEARVAFVMIIAMTLLTGAVYPLAITGLAQVLFPRQAHGSLVERGGKVIGSDLIGQRFAQAKYFHGRPSAAGDKGYDAANSSGSNLGPTSKALFARMGKDVAQLKTENAQPIPVDLVTTSGSGLDPDITPAAALFQVPRVARARGLSEEEVRELVARHIEPRVLDILGEPRVNVLRLNLALDRLAAVPPPAR
jgi:K+-transporting ATPase ATPase C chain